MTSIRVPRERTILSVSALIHINAPAQRVFNALLDTPKYGRWNTFIPGVTITSQPDHVKDDSTLLQLGTLFNFHVVMNSSKPDSQTPTSLKVSSISTPERLSDYVPEDMIEGDACFYPDQSKVYRVTWIDHGSLQSRALQVERFHEVIVLGENECEVSTWECQDGILAYVVKWLYGEVLEEKFQDWVKGLKQYCESAYGDA
ncbi:hypothetical protein LTR86_006922 [Recurvomyces mirabilis]|nr:hypothetical protein LTR86_006922 [Recurvomyces mirabilis]